VETNGQSLDPLILKSSKFVSSGRMMVFIFWLWYLLPSPLSLILLDKWKVVGGSANWNLSVLTSMWMDLSFVLSRFFLFPVY